MLCRKSSDLVTQSYEEQFTRIVSLRPLNVAIKTSNVSSYGAFDQGFCVAGVHFQWDLRQDLMQLRRIRPSCPLWVAQPSSFLQEMYHDRREHFHGGRLYGAWH